MGDRLAGKVAIVTGASRGIGRGLAWAMANEGADVVVNYTQAAAEAESIVNQINGLGRKAIAVKADMANKSEIDDMIALTVEKFKRIDVLVNNAGLSLFTHFFDITEEVWDRTLDVNLRGVFFATQAAARHMVQQKWGRVINISSCGAKVAFNHMPHYCASKGGLLMLTSQMGVELGPYGITVNAVAPGLIRTEANAPILAEKRVLDFYVERIPVGRAGEPSDVAGSVIFLATDEAAYITGQHFYVDGGWANHAPEPLFDPPKRD